MSANVHIIAARRTPIAPKDGALKAIESHQLATAAALFCLEDAGIPAQLVDEVVISCSLGMGGNQARLVALKLGLPEKVAGLTIDRQCCGGLDALLIAEAMIKSKRANIVLAGGCESYSQRPALYQRLANGKYADKPIGQAPFTPWSDRDPNMHAAANRLSQLYRISKEEQDEWAIQSHQKARRSQSILRNEVASVADLEVSQDTFTRNLSHRTCARAKKIYGSITAANMSVEADGAAVCLVVSEEVAKVLPSVELVGGVTVGGNPELPGIVPVAAIEETFGNCGLVSAEQLLVAEIMEAYAVQAIATARLATINPKIINLRGGSLARGHPIGASGAVLAVRIFHELISQTDQYGLAAIAAAGGLGTAVLFRGAETNKA